MTTPLEVDGPRPGVAWASTVEVDHPDDRVLLVVLACDSFDGRTCSPLGDDLLTWCGWSSNRDRLYAARKRLEARHRLAFEASKGGGGKVTKRRTTYHLLRPADPVHLPGSPDGVEASHLPAHLPGSPDGEGVTPSGAPSGAPSGIPGSTLPFPNPQSSSPASDDQLPVLVGVRADDDETRESLNGIPGVRPTPTVRELVGEYLNNGWSAVQVNALLRLGMSGDPTNPMGCLTTILRDHRGEAAPRPTVGLWDPSTWCGDCDEYGRWVEDEDGTTRKCPTCHPGMVGKPKPVRHNDDPAPIAAPGAFTRMTQGDKRRMMGGRR